MTNEAVLIIETELALPFTVADGTGIEKGSICKLSDLMTAALATADEDIPAGIAKSEKIASDGMTKLDIYRGGIFRVTASGDITVGDAVGIAGDGSINYVYSLTGAAISGGKQLGIALETAVDEDTFLMELKPGFISIQAS